MSGARRDRYGRYLITPPSGGEAVAHTRATTVAEVLDDRFNLERYNQRNVVLGLVARPDLWAMAQSYKAENKQELNALCKDAITASAASARANVGTALHSFTERIDAGEDVDVPAPWDRDVNAYLSTLEGCGIEVNPSYIESIAVCDGLLEPVAGTLDRLVTWEGRQLIGDLKTGRSLDFSWRKIAIQLAIYARADSIYNPETDEHEPMPEVDQDQAVVFHLPAGEGTCTPYLVDIRAGWEALEHSLWTRAWRKRSDLAEPIKAQMELAS